MLLFFIKPELSDNAPGVQTPMETLSLDSWTSSRTRFLIDSKIDL